MLQSSARAATRCDDPSRNGCPHTATPVPVAERRKHASAAAGTRSQELGDEVLYVLDGEIDVHIGNEVVPAGPGSTFHFPAGTKEWFEDRTQATVLVTYLPGGIDKFFTEIAEPALSRTVPPPSDTPPDFERIVRVAAQYGMNIEAPPH